MRIFHSLVAAAAVLASAVAGAQDFPKQPIKIIVPFPPGSSTDIVTRLVAEELRSGLGQTVTVENRAGGTGLIGVAALARSPADGYTIGVGNEGTHVTAPLLRKKLPFDAVEDFTPLTIAIRTTMAIAVNTRVLPVKNLQELIELSKTKPGGISYGTPGTGAPQHLIGELLKQRTGGNFVHVPYSGGGPATNDLIAGHTPMSIVTLPSILPHRDKITILAVGDAQRAAVLPDVPTISETVPDFVVSGWSGYFAPAKLPPQVATRLNAALVEALKKPPVVEAIRKQGMDPAGTPAEDLHNLVRSGIVRWAPVIEKAQIPKQD